MVTIITGPSGSGKTTLLSNLHRRRQCDVLKIHTTRKRRVNETDFEYDFLEELHEDIEYAYILNTPVGKYGYVYPEEGTQTALAIIERSIVEKVKAAYVKKHITVGVTTLAPRDEELTNRGDAAEVAFRKSLHKDI